MAQVSIEPVLSHPMDLPDTSHHGDHGTGMMVRYKGKGELVLGEGSTDDSDRELIVLYALQLLCSANGDPSLFEDIHREFVRVGVVSSTMPSKNGQFQRECERAFRRLGLGDEARYLRTMMGRVNRDEHALFSYTRQDVLNLPSQSIPRTLAMDPFVSMWARNSNRYAREFEQLEFLGRGGFAHVYKARNRLDGETYAMKHIRVRKPGHTDYDDLCQLVLREVTSLAKLDHPHVVRYYQAWIEPTVEDAPYALLTHADDDELEESMVSGYDSDSESDSDFSTRMIVPSGNILFPTAALDSTSSSPSMSSGSPHLSPGTRVKVVPLDGNTPLPEISLDSRSGSLPSSPSMYAAGRTAAAKKTIHIHLIIQMQYCPHDTLKEWIENPSRVPNQEHNQRIVVSILEGLKHIHEKDLLHRDLKPANIFLDKGMHVKIGDFGLAKDVSIPFTQDKPCFHAEDCDCSQDDLNTLDAHEHTTGVGTATYAAPEQLEAGRAPCSFASDLYSLGIIMLEMYNLPFSTAMERADVIRTARQGVLPSGVTKSFPQVAPIILKLLSGEPADRGSADDILRAITAKPIGNEDGTLELQLASAYQHMANQDTLIRQQALRIQELEAQLRKLERSQGEAMS